MRETYINFFKERGHAQISSAPLIPENDPTVLFTTAGMHPLVPYLLGEKHPAGKRLTDFQKCVRTGDIDEVGDASHLTFFEMLGNWSLGDYFKKESIAWSYELLTEVLGIRRDQLAVTVFAGDADAPRDDETADLWRSHGMTDDQIFFYGKADNWWGPAGQTGPCGPDTEIFFDDGRPKCGPDCGPSCHCGKYTEIWNNVFMQYFKDADGKFTPLKQMNVDTGMGLERILRVLNHVETVYDTPLFTGIIGKIEEITGKEYGSDEETTRAFRIVADHLRAATFILGDGVVPAKIGQGYILRRLIRRASRYLSKLGMDDVCMRQVAEVVVSEYSKAYPELERNKDFIYSNITAEEEKFHKTLVKGLRRFNEMIAESGDAETLPGDMVFRLYDTFGFPVELTQELAKKLIELRKEVGLSQPALAKKLGLTQNAIWRYEKGIAAPSYSTIIQFADYFDVSLDWLFGRTDKREGKLYKGVNRDDQARLEYYLSNLLDSDNKFGKAFRKALDEAVEKRISEK